MIEMKKLMTFACAAAVGLAFVGCSKDEKKPEAAPAAAPAKADEKKPEAAAAPAAGGGDVGVQECDDYIKKMEACMGKMPAEAKAAMEQGFKQSKDAWTQAAATPQGKEGLKTACKAALDALANNPACK